MSTEATFWKAIGVTATLLAIAVSTFVAYDLYYRGPSPEKHVELTTLSPIDLLSGLSALRDRATMSLAVEGETYNNIVIAQAYFTNAGPSPIVPSDYHQKLSVSVKAPWKIVAVENGRHAGQQVAMDWKRISETRFEAEPALLNPGDRFGVSVYLTNRELSAPHGPEDAPDPKIEWDARITNLRDFSKPGDLFDWIGRERSVFPPIIVYLSGWAVVFTIALALLLQAFYLHLLIRADLMQEWRWSTIGLVVCTSLLSFVAAECVATYLFKSIVNYYGVNHWMNGTPIILNAVLLAFLWWWVRYRPEKPPLEAG